MMYDCIKLKNSGSTLESKRDSFVVCSPEWNLYNYMLAAIKNPLWYSLNKDSYDVIIEHYLKIVEEKKAENEFIFDELEKVFFFLSCPNTLFTVCKTSDRANSKICYNSKEISNFYHNLKEQYSKDFKELLFV